MLWQPKGPTVTCKLRFIKHSIGSQLKEVIVQFCSTLSSSIFVQFGALQDKKDIKLLASRARATNMVKGIKGKTYEEWLCSHGLFSLEKRRVRQE